MFSLGMEPSITSTNGASSSSRAAARNGARNSSPPSVGESTLLCRLTFGMPGIAPSSTSSMPGWPAAVTDTESPSQLIPSEIQRMSSSSTPATWHLLHRQRVNEQLLAPEKLHVEAPAAMAGEREAVEFTLGPARAAAAGGGHHFQLQLRALGRRSVGDERPREGQRVGHHLAQ